MEGNYDVKGESNLLSDRASIIVCDMVHKVDLFYVYYGLSPVIAKFASTGCWLEASPGIMLL